MDGTESGLEYRQLPSKGIATTRGPRLHPPILRQVDNALQPHPGRCSADVDAVLLAPHHDLLDRILAQPRNAVEHRCRSLVDVDPPCHNGLIAERGVCQQGFQQPSPAGGAAGEWAVQQATGILIIGCWLETHPRIDQIAQRSQPESCRPGQVDFRNGLRMP